MFYEWPCTLKITAWKAKRLDTMPNLTTRKNQSHVQLARDIASKPVPIN